MNALFLPDGDTVVATEFARGPWDPAACHGGPVAALLTRACEQVDDAAPDSPEWQLARITVELVRPVPVGVPLTIAAAIERPGRNVSLVAAHLVRADGTEVARARALRIRADNVPLGTYVPEPSFGEPGAGVETSPAFETDQVVYHKDSVEMRFADGTWQRSGAVALWCRLRVSVVPDEVPTGPQRAAATADFSNGVSAELDPSTHTFINPDLSIHLSRAPEGEWIGMQARSHYGDRGAGFAEGALFDARGRCGRSVQSLIVVERS